VILVVGKLSGFSLKREFLFLMCSGTYSVLRLSNFTPFPDDSATCYNVIISTTPTPGLDETSSFPEMFMMGWLKSFAPPKPVKPDF